MAKKTILIVEDEQGIANLYKIGLSRSGYNVVIHTDGASALKYLKKNTPDAIVLDFNLPKVSGMEVLQAIRATKRLSKVPVIAATAHLSYKEAVGSAVQAFILKPFKISELTRELNRLIA